MRRFFKEHEGEYLDFLALLTALRERHAGSDHKAFVDAVDGIIAELYQHRLLSLPGYKWISYDVELPKSTRKWFSQSSDSILWNEKFQAYIMGICRTDNSGLFILPERRNEQPPWYSEIDSTTIYELLFVLLLLALMLFN